MQITLFCEGKNIQFNVSEEQGSVFIQSCKDLLINEGISLEELALMDNDRIFRKAVGSMDYNFHHNVMRLDRSVKVFSLDNRIREEEDDGELPLAPSAEDEYLSLSEEERVKEIIYRHLPPSQADVVYLHVIKNLSFKKIGKRLNKKPNTCSHAYYDAVKNLKKNESDIQKDLFPWLTL